MITVADLFCGAGGTSTGLMEACAENGRTVRLTAINHWDVAVATHTSNHPSARHLCTSLDSVNPRDLFNEGELDLLWASPECTHHSIARGGKPVTDQGRATAWCVVRWAEALRPAVILIENVREFETWGPIGSNGRPLKGKKGEIFHAWCNALRSLGYRVEWRVLCAADYGDPTTRRRLFIYAVRGRRKIVWPAPSHAPLGDSDMLGARQPWVAAREIIDWTVPGQSIYKRKRPLAEKTLSRIQIGLEKFGFQPFIVPHRTFKNMMVDSITEPLRTVTVASAGFGLCQPYLIKFRGTGKAASVDNPSPAVTAGGGHLGLCQPFLVSIDHQTNAASGVSSPNAPLTAVTTKQRHAVCTPYLVQYYGTADAASIDEPLAAVTTKPRFGLVQPIILLDGNKYILDILFRMLKPGELARAQGFPSTYQFAGNIAQVVKQIGNAVPKNMAKALTRTALAQL